MKGSPFDVIDFAANEGNFKIEWSRKTPFVNFFEVGSTTIKRVPFENEEAF